MLSQTCPSHSAKYFCVFRLICSKAKVDGWLVNWKSLGAHISESSCGANNFDCFVKIGACFYTIQMYFLFSISLNEDSNVRKLKANREIGGSADKVDLSEAIYIQSLRMYKRKNKGFGLQ